MFEYDRIKHQLILEVLSSHSLVQPKHIQTGAKKILDLNLNDKMLARFLIHTYQNGYIGKNSYFFNQMLRKCLRKNKFEKIKSLLSDLSKTWPELSDSNNKITSKQMLVIQTYYKFHNDFVHTVLNKIEKPIFFFDICPFYHVKYEVDFKKHDNNYYSKCLLKYKEQGGLIPSKQLY
jgi:hypothetical protein